MDVNASASEGSGGSGVCIGAWRKEDSYYEVADKLRMVSCGYVEKSLSDKWIFG